MTATNKHLLILAFLTLINPLWAANPYYCHRQVIINLCCFAHQSLRLAKMDINYNRDSRGSG